MIAKCIKWEKGLVRKPEVLRIARAMGCTPQHAAACCMLVWEWAEDVDENGLIVGRTAADVSIAAGIDGIGEAMMEVGWLMETGGAVALPDWDRHNSEPSKKRARKALYMRTYRAGKKTQQLRKHNHQAAVIAELGHVPIRSAAQVREFGA
jgi:hypothetical protein